MKQLQDIDTRGRSKGLEEADSLSSESRWSSQKSRNVSSTIDYQVLFYLKFYLLVSGTQRLYLLMVASVLKLPPC